MNVKTFIDRPIFAGVISVMILLVGLIGLTQLPAQSTICSNHFQHW